ncbi:MAG TPA: hypothetical protein VGF93_05890 [Solirubrobacteraceae bacterium]|jgi:hypothetical protein
MSADEQLLYEARVRPRQAVIAGVAAFALIAAAALQITGPHTKVSEITIGLITEHKRAATDVIGSVIQMVGWLTLTSTLVFLLRASKARNPRTPGFIRILAIVGGIGAAFSGVISAVVIAIKANDFVSHGNQTYEQAHAVTTSAVLVVPQILVQASALLIAISVVMVCVHAMRVGLLTRFLGYLGMFAGALIIIPIVQLPVVQAYWLAAVAYLLYGRWPSGMPKAWETGRAEAWPSSQQLREQRNATMGKQARSKPGRGKPAPEPEPVAEPVAARTTRSTTPKRKRKRRH